MAWGRASRWKRPVSVVIWVGLSTIIGLIAAITCHGFWELSERADGGFVQVAILVIPAFVVFASSLYYLLIYATPQHKTFGWMTIGWLLVAVSFLIINVFWFGLGIAETT